MQTNMCISILHFQHSIAQHWCEGLILQYILVSHTPYWEEFWSTKKSTCSYLHVPNLIKENLYIYIFYFQT